MFVDPFRVIFDIYFHQLKMIFQIFVSKEPRSVDLKNNSFCISKLQVSCRSCFNILTQNYAPEK